jgi:hypothetical protein
VAEVSASGTLDEAEGLGDGVATPATVDSVQVDEAATAELLTAASGTLEEGTGLGEATLGTAGADELAPPTG